MIGVGVNRLRVRRVFVWRGWFVPRRDAEAQRESAESSGLERLRTRMSANRHNPTRKRGSLRVSLAPAYASGYYFRPKRDSEV